ncbi:MAG: hypothetical protein FJ387_14690 [Verrucomicrobia bacterium]|nr:hypothetical protein [Verrucomicrobiota bacterium]
MSIYATLWTLKFPRDGDLASEGDWIAVHAQAVPPHIGTPTPGQGYEQGDPYASFLPPPVVVDEAGAAPYHRAVVFVTEHSSKGTERNPQEYVAPLLVLTGEEYARIGFAELHRRLGEALRANGAPAVAEIARARGSRKQVRSGEVQPKVSTEALDLSRPVDEVRAQKPWTDDREKQYP